MFCVIYHRRNDADACSETMAAVSAASIGAISDPLVMHAALTVVMENLGRSDVRSASEPTSTARPAPARLDHSPLDCPLFPSDAGMLRTTLMVGDERLAGDQRRPPDNFTVVQSQSASSG